MLSEVPEGWDKARIDSVLQRNTTSVSVAELAAEGLVAHYSLPAFDANKKPVIESGSEIKSNKTAIDKDCLLFSKLNPRIPRVWRVRHFGEQKPVCSTEFWALKPKTGEVSLSYAEYFLGWNGFLSHPTIKPASSTNSHQRVDRKAFDAFMLPLPPLNEQHRIAEILSSVDASIKATQAVIEQAERVKRGLMEELLTSGFGSEAIERGEVPEGWVITKLADLTTKIGSGVTPKGGKKAYVESGFQLIRSQNVGWGEMLLDDVAFITPEQHEKMDGTKLKKGDVLLNITGASIGRSAIYDGETGAANVNQHVCILRTKEVLTAGYLNAWLLSHAGQKTIDTFQAGGNRQGLNFQQIGSFSIPLPPLNEQQRIAEIVSSVNDFITAQNSIVEQNVRTKRGLMDDLLTGKVRTV